LFGDADVLRSPANQADSSVTPNAEASQQ
jgi:hypothetical protein